MLRQASPAWNLYGGIGVEPFDREPVAGDVLHGGEIGYHLRPGEHKLKLEDWKQYIVIPSGKHSRIGGIKWP